MINFEPKLSSMKFENEISKCNYVCSKFVIKEKSSNDIRTLRMN